MSSKVRIVWVLLSLVALAVILTPVLSFPNVNPSGNNNIISEQPINETAIAPPEITQDDFDLCNSINDDVKFIMVDVDESRMNASRKIASDLLLGEYCNRPALVHEINATGYPGLNLVAYACDSASGKIGDTQLKDSLSDHRALYCESAAFSIHEEAETLRASVEGFRQDFIGSLKEDNSTATNTELIAELEASVDEIVSMIDNAQALLAEGQNYDSAKMLDAASRAFEAAIEKAGQEA